MQQDLYQHPDYYLMDELLTDEHKLIRDTVRAYVKKEISPIIEEYAQKAAFPSQIIKGLGELGCFGPFVPQEYGGAGLDYISYGIMMQELERGDSGIRSTASVQGSLVMYPIIRMAARSKRKNTCLNWRVASGWVVSVLPSLTMVPILPVCYPTIPMPVTT